MASTPWYDWYSKSLNQRKCSDPFGQFQRWVHASKTKFYQKRL